MDVARASGDFESVGNEMQRSSEGVHEKTMAVLTEVQRKALTDWIFTRSQRGPGFSPRPGGFGQQFGGPGDGNQDPRLSNMRVGQPL